MPTRDRENSLEIEIQEEIASAYFVACRKMVDSLEALKVFDRDMKPEVRHDQQLSGRANLVESAAERVHFVIIQREAMKLSWYEGFFEDYGIPDEVRARMGTGRC